MIFSLGSAGQISGREYRPDTHLNQTLVMLQAGQVEVVAIVMPLIFGQSLLILCGYFTYIFEIREHLKLCFVVIL